MFDCVLQRLWTRLVWSGLGTRDLNLCSLSIRYTGDSKTDPLVDLEIRTSLCSEDQMAIQIQNRVISREWLLLHHFLIYCCQYYLHVICIIPCDYLTYLTNMITRIISFDINDRTPYISSWYEHLLTLFHVLEIRRIDLGLVLICYKPELIL